MTVLLSRPAIAKYSKEEMINCFSRLAGPRAPPGKIDFDVLKSAMRNGAGGMDPSVAEEIMTMMAHIQGGFVDYIEIVNLFLGTNTK